MTFLMTPHLHWHCHNSVVYKCASDPPNAHRDSPHYVCTLCIKTAEEHIRIAGQRRAILSPFASIALFLSMTMEDRKDASAGIRLT